VENHLAVVKKIKNNSVSLLLQIFFEYYNFSIIKFG
jgi:hypothetical protein